jgi:molecular chaperone GrpE
MSEKKDKKKEEKKSKKPSFEIQAAENLAGWQKALADYQNLEKEMDKRLSGMNDFVASSFILELLPIFDNYQVAVSHIPEAEQKSSWAVGLEHILKMWEGFLTEHGIDKIKTIDDQFDPNLHEAVGQIVDEDQDDQIIIEEKLAGYSSKDRVIRPAKVIINNLG